MYPKNKKTKRKNPRSIQSPNTFFIRHTADKLISRSDEGFCDLSVLQREVQKKYRDISVRYDMMVNYLIGGDYFIDCLNHRVMKLNSVDIYDEEESE